jgi:two-component system CheB/CheR fusion protein
MRSRKSTTQRPRKAARKARRASPNHAIDSPLPRGLTVAAIGASAGGLEALTQMIDSLPADPGLVIVILQHMAADHESALPHLLAVHTRLPVVQVTHGVQMRVNHIYVVPPNVQMTMSGDRLLLASRPADRSRHTPIDTFFSSVADAAGNRAIAVVLSGTASDGALGIRDVKAAGGITIAQQPDTAKYDSMPRAALASGFIDLVLEPAAIGRELGAIAQQPYVRRRPAHSGDQIGEAQLEEVFELLRPMSGVDFRHYKQPTIRRRLLRRMALHRSDSIESYIKLLRQDPHELRGLFQDLLIQVTRFFREPESFAALRKDVIPKLLKSLPTDQPLRFWVCGCATGEEAYSLAMSAVEAIEGSTDRNVRVQIFATDISDVAVDQARNGTYPQAIEADVGQARLRRFFSRIDGQYRVNKQLRDMCVFARQDVTKDPPFSRLDLVMCRNVLIYMDTPLQRRLLGMFHYALNPHGYLMLGQAETVGSEAGLFAVADKKHRIHRKRGMAAALPALTLPPGSLPTLMRKPAGSVIAGRDKALELEASRALIERYAPPGVLVDADLQIVQFHGHTGDFLEPSPGEASLHLLKMAKEGLLHGLRTAISTARKSKKALRRDGLHVRSGDDWQSVSIEVVPIVALGRPHFLVLFEKLASPAAAAGTRSKKRTGRAKPAGTAQGSKLELMRRELAASRDYLQSIIQELEAANEELQSANEEILSSNEELQSTNEELDTAKEELQSTNEELNTVNDELQTRNEEVGRINGDLINLLASIHVAIVIVGGDLRIRRFTPMAEKILNLIPADIGRVIGHIKPNINCPDLERLIVECMDSVTPLERDVQDLQGRWYSLRIRPYKSLDNKIDGAVLALFDVDLLKRAERWEPSAGEEATS